MNDVQAILDRAAEYSAERPEDFIGSALATAGRLRHTHAYYTARLAEMAAKGVTDGPSAENAKAHIAASEAEYPAVAKKVASLCDAIKAKFAAIGGE
jgi:hypothetical protein